MRIVGFLIAIIVIAPEITAYDFTPRNRRDPFTFRLDVQVEETISVAAPALDIERVQVEAGAMYQKAHTAMGERNTDEVKQNCSAALKLLNQIPRIPLIVKVEELRQKLASLNKAAEKLQQRREAQKAFDALKLSVSGVLMRDNGAHAIIDGHVLKAGEALLSSEERLVVESISTDRVIMMFRGFKMAGMLGRSY